MAVNRLQRADQDSGGYLSRLSRASVMLNENLDLDTVLQRVADGARLIVDAECGVLSAFDEKEDIAALVTSGLPSNPPTAEEGEESAIVGYANELRQRLTSLSAGTGTWLRKDRRRLRLF